MINFIKRLFGLSSSQFRLHNIVKYKDSRWEILAIYNRNNQRWATIKREDQKLTYFNKDVLLDDLELVN